MALDASPISVVGCGPVRRSISPGCARCRGGRGCPGGQPASVGHVPAHPGFKTVWHSDSASLLNEVDRLRSGGKRGRCWSAAIRGCAAWLGRWSSGLGWRTWRSFRDQLGASGICAAGAGLVRRSNSQRPRSQARRPAGRPFPMGQDRRFGRLTRIAAMVGGRGPHLGGQPRHLLVRESSPWMASACARWTPAQLGHVRAASLSIVLFIRRDLVA